LTCPLPLSKITTVMNKIYIASITEYPGDDCNIFVGKDERTLLDKVQTFLEGYTGEKFKLKSIKHAEKVFEDESLEDLYITFHQEGLDLH